MNNDQQLKQRQLDNERILRAHLNDSGSSFSKIDRLRADIAALTNEIMNVEQLATVIKMRNTK